MTKFKRVEVKIGKCKGCKGRKKLIDGLCSECRSTMIRQAQRKGREHNPVIG